MPPTSPASPAPHRLRRLGTALLLTVGLIAPGVAAGADTTGPDGSAIEIARRGGDTVTAADATASAANDPIVVRDLSDACPAGQVSSSGFQDIPRGYTFTLAIDCLVGYGITVGRTATTYDPAAPVTRAQMAVFLHRLLDDVMVLPAPPTRSQFSDVAITGEVGRAINVLASDQLAAVLGQRIVAGRTATTFDPSGTVTRAQMGSFIARTLEGLLEVKGFEITDRGRCDGVFSDERAIPSAHATNVKLLCSAGIVTGRTDGTYGPAAAVTRGQMAAFLMRTVDPFTEEGILRPAHLREELFVDRGTEAEPCDDAGRDGSSGSPFCTIQAAVDAAGALADHHVRVWVRWAPGQPAYEEVWLELDPGDAAALDVVGLAADGGRVPYENIILMEGDADTFTTLGRFRVVSPEGIDIGTAGYAAISDVRTDGYVAILVYQPETGDTYVLGSDLRAVEGTIVVASAGMVESRGTRYATPEMVYVLIDAPDMPGATAQTLFRDHFTDPALGNRFESAPVVGEVDGRPALLPAS